MVRYLSEEELRFLNRFLIERYSPMEQAGVKDLKLLQSALGRPKQSMFGEDLYPGIYLKAAALFESLTQNHPFHNANKRTGFAAMKQFLWVNGYDFRASEQEAEDFTVYVVVEKPSSLEIANWIEAFSVKRDGSL
ncbi:type II toxin-antitoxin system death-on-curing family toxin [Salinicoccus roseus]|uniref:type II toxin-antitoxin system death-on-curing family toxin n=1 Tax=Salinicoccus roseus TaxID=45670 RepID=UPI001EF58818|nr:type II toxin-antitoxin system death-on-curing family toxin [Salinicoccus roseus]MCG7333142.1 type II toxin-antitoxin system death-on-curing family toxin [Salinicoccus roseus]